MAAAVVATLATAALSGGPAGKPHLWMIVADDLGFGDLGYTGSSIKTPEIDALATSGVILGAPTLSRVHQGAAAAHS